MGGVIHLGFEVSSFSNANEGLGINKTTSDYPILIHSNINNKVNIFVRYLYKYPVHKCKFIMHPATAF